MLEDILKTVGIAAVASGAFAWLVRSLTTHRLNKDIEEHKNRLRSDAAIELESLKHQLRLSAVEHERRFALLQERRAGVIAELYKRLVKGSGAAGSFASLVEVSGEPVDR